MPIQIPQLGGAPPPGQALLHSVGRILSQDRFYEIPNFQRWYSWQITEVEAFLEDVANCPPNEPHSFGTIEATNSGNQHPWNVGQQGADVPQEILLISDGQQRLTSMFLFWFATAAYEAGNGRDDLKDHIQWFFFRDDIGAGNPRPFLKLQEDSLNLALEHIARYGHLQGIPPANQNSAMKRMAAAYDQILDYLSAFPTDAAREAYWDKMMQQTEVVLVLGQANPYVKFEVRNNRGRDVSNLDRTKNLIELINIRTARPHPGYEFAQKWYNSMKALDENRLFSMDDELLGHTQTVHDGEHFGIGNYQTFHKEYSILATNYDNANPDHATKITEITDFITCFEDMTTAYTEVFSPSRNGLWKLYGNFQKYSAHANFSRAKRGHMIAILSDICLRLDYENIFDTNILAMYHSIENPDDFIRCLRQLEKVLFRVYHVRGKRTDHGKRFRAGFAKQIYDWGGTQPALVTFILTELCNFCITQSECTLDRLYSSIRAPEPAYEKKWSLYFLFHWQVRKYRTLLLGSVTSRWQKDHNGPDKSGRRGYLFTKEHILPNEGWLDWKEEDDGDFYWTRAPDTRFTERNDYQLTKHYLGNLVMSKQWLNSRYSNHPYQRLAGDNRNYKHDFYLNSGDWSSVRHVALNYDDWSKATIADRQERMARWAILRWKLECDTDALDNALPNIPFIEEHSDFFKEQRRGEQAAGIDEHDEEDLHYPEGDDHEEDQTPEISEDLDGYDFPEDFYTDEE